MSVLIPALVVILWVTVILFVVWGCIYLINLIPFPAGTPYVIIKFVLIVIVAVLGLIKLFGYLN